MSRRRHVFRWWALFGALAWLPLLLLLHLAARP